MAIANTVSRPIRATKARKTSLQGDKRSVRCTLFSLLDTGLGRLRKLGKNDPPLAANEATGHLTHPSPPICRHYSAVKRSQKGVAPSLALTFGPQSMRAK